MLKMSFSVGNSGIQLSNKKIKFEFELKQQQKNPIVRVPLFVCPHTELSCDSPCAFEIIHKAVMLSYASIKHHLQSAGLRMKGG